MRYERVTGGAAVVVAVVGVKNGLLIRNLDREDPKWKLCAETVKPGESILNTVLAAATEEAGMKDIKTELGEDGKIARFTDPRIRQVVEFGEPEWIERTKHPHWRHFYGIFTTDEVIHQLSGEHHVIVEETADGRTEEEHIETMEFPLKMLDSISSLLRQHAELIRSIPQRKQKIIE